MLPQELLDHLDQAQLWPGRPDAAPHFGDVAAAFQRALAVRGLRQARGERAMGFKIGFTNRTIWERYRVFAPIWGTVWNSTLTHADSKGQGVLSLMGTCQPRIEPECVFGLRCAPPANASLDQLAASIAWVAPGFEVVQSHCLNWQFHAAETVADGGLHARLLVGPPVLLDDVERPGAAALATRLASARVHLMCDDREVDSGVGANVLDSPLHALLHFLRELRACPGAPDLQAGDVVTTGTWTDAWPVKAGQRWRARFEGALPGMDSLAVTFE